MKRYSRFRRVGRPQNRNWPHIRLVVAMLFLICLLAGVGYWSKVQANNQEEDRVRPVQAELIKAQQSASESAQLAQDLKDKLERSASYQTDEKVKALSRFYIKKYFNKDAERVEKVMNCESGLDPKRVHINKDKSTDSGLYQIHDEPTHRKNIEKMYGMPFELAVHDLEVSSKYAAFLWNRNRNNWVCNRLV